ncbi:hypothetical protein ACA910_014603 [Epithemia clementina (nom. ined.)]
MDHKHSTGDAPLSDEELRKLLKPHLSKDQAKYVLVKSYANDGDQVEVVQQLDSYDDVNFKVTVKGKYYLLKIHNGVESKDFIKVYNAAGQDFYKKGCLNSVIHLQSTIMALLSANGIGTNQPITARDTNAPVCIHSLPVVSEDHSPQQLAVRLLSWVEGRPMSDATVLPIESLAEAGRFLGQLDKVLDHISDKDTNESTATDAIKTDSSNVVIDRSILEPAARFHQWDGKNTSDLRSFTPCIDDERKRSLVVSILDAFKRDIIDSGDYKEFRLGVNHGDYNDANILQNDDLSISGVIDFGDSVQSWRVLDVTVAMAYSMLSVYGKPNRSISAAAALLRGFTMEYPLTSIEKKHVALLVACRLACSVTLGAYSYIQNPTNHYLLLHAQPAWKALEMLEKESIREVFAKVLDQACTFDEKSSGTIDCSDLTLPDPVVVDLLASVRIKPTDLDARPPKRPRTRHDDGRSLVTFVTGNQKKMEELTRILKTNENEDLPFHLTNQNVELSELQGDPIEIAKQKCASAAREVGGAVITEDTSLCFNALGGLPGPYIKWFLESCGLKGLNKILDGYADKTAYAQTVVAFASDPDKTPIVFVGKTFGKIVMPRGRLDFGWDPVFQPDDGAGDKTYAEMTKVEKDAISHRSRALAQLQKYFKEHPHLFA